MRARPTVEMFHGTAYANHASIMRHGLRPSPYGGPWVTPDPAEAVDYAVWVTQCYRARSPSARDPQGVVYRLEIPRARIVDAQANATALSLVLAKTPREYCVPGGVPVDWVKDAERVSVPADPPVSDTGRILGRQLGRARHVRATCWLLAW